MTGPRSPLFTSVRRPPRRRWWRGVKIFLVLAVVLALLTAGLVGIVWAEAALRLGGEDVPALEAPGEQAATEEGVPTAPDGATTVLVAMVEEHDSTAPRPAPLTGPVALVQAADTREGIAVLALPPELEVEVEGVGRAPLSDVHREDGPNLLAQAVMDYSGVRLDHVVVASQDALPQLTEAVGGTERCGDTGCRVLDADAVRARTMEGDPGDRVREAAETVRAVGAALGPWTPLRHPLRSRSVVGTISGEVVTDVSLRGRRLLEVADALGSPRPLELAVLPSLRNPDSEELLVPPEQAAVLFQHLQQGTPFAGEAEAESFDLLPDEVTVGVLNGTGTPGLAGRIQSQLEGIGFDVAGTDNATSFDHTQTQVTYDASQPDAEVAAILMVQQLEGATLQASEVPLLVEGDRVDVTVTVGADLDDGGEDGD